MHGLYIIIAINYWIRDVIREYIKKYEEKIQKRKQGIKISRIHPSRTLRISKHFISIIIYRFKE